MSEGKECRLWNFWAPYFAITINANRDPKKSSPIRVEDIHPYLTRKKAHRDMSDFMGVMKSIAKKSKFNHR